MAEQLQYRGKARASRTVRKPTGYHATAPNEVWSWDITCLATTMRSLFFRLYLELDIYSRKIVAWEVYDTETAEQAAAVIRNACLAESVRRDQLVLHSDNGAPMKGATMLATLQRLGIVPSFSRPSVSDDNPYSESLFQHGNIRRPIRRSRLAALRRPVSGCRHLSTGITRCIDIVGFDL